MQFQELFMNLALNISKKSRCIKKQVGAVISKNNKIISTGYNGPPLNSSKYNCNYAWTKQSCPRTKDGSCLFSIHAEHNAINFAQKKNVDLKNSELYTTLSPCLNCSKIIFTSGIEKVYYLDLYSEYKNVPEDGLKFLEEFGVKTLNIKSVALKQ